MDTHTVYNELTKDNTFSDKQASALVKVSRNLATKSDVLKLKKEFKRDMNDLRKETQSEFKLIRSEMQTIFNKLQVNLLFAMASMTGIIIAAMKLF